MELQSLSGDGSKSIDTPQSCDWYKHKTLVKEVFYVQSLLIFIVIVSSIVNVARGISNCDKQIWILLLSSGIAQMLSSPTVGKDSQKRMQENFDSTDTTNGSVSDGRKTNYTRIWYKRTSRHREIFYVQAVMVFLVVMSSIVFLSLDVGDKNILIVLLSTTYSQFLPGPQFIQKKSSSL